jgi:hypothetical protein
MARVLKSSFIAFLISALTFIGLMQSAQAVMIGTGEAVATAPTGRAHLNALLERPDVQSQFETLGISKADAQSRVATMSDAEVASLDNKISSLPAGGDGIIGALVLIFVILLITDLLGFTKVFPFTHPIQR